MTAIPPFHARLEALRPRLVRFAQLQLRNEALGEAALTRQGLPA
jgi:hypothetical protein